jgi:hypothetical protein
MRVTVLLMTALLLAACETPKPFCATTSCDAGNPAGGGSSGGGVNTGGGNGMGGGAATGGGMATGGSAATGGGGGGAATCNLLTCTGCCDADTCVPTAAQSAARCGRNGAACMACTGTQDCRTSGTSPGTCYQPGTGLGAPCVNDSDCTGVDLSNPNGGPAICQKIGVENLPGEVQVAGISYPGGYCTRRCSTGEQCGSGNFCATYGGEWGDVSNICVKGCVVSNDCRAGYVCFAADLAHTPFGVCVPSNLPDGGLATFDAGPGPSPATLGKDCTTDADCRGETGYGLCLSGLLADGGQSGYGGGECVADCSMSPDDSWCNGDPVGTFPVDAGARCDAASFMDAGIPSARWLCKNGCTTSADCKAGYHCHVDTSNGRVCEPNCDNVGASDACPAGSCLSSWGCLVFATCNSVTHDCQ